MLEMAPPAFLQDVTPCNFNQSLAEKYLKTKNLSPTCSPHEKGVKISTQPSKTPFINISWLLVTEFNIPCYLWIRIMMI